MSNRKLRYLCVLVAVLVAGMLFADTIRVGGKIQAAKIVYKVNPVYPPEAKAQGIEGTVRLETTIDAEGAVKDIRMLSGPDALVNASVEAVKKWRYEPTFLDGKAVEVITTVDINFTLAK